MKQNMQAQKAIFPSGGIFVSIGKEEK